MANIKWTATASNPEWITLSAGTQVGFSITGEGDTYINITVTPTGPGESPETGTVEFRGVDDESLVKVIEVQRCGSGCGCDTFRTKALPENNRVGFNSDDDSDVKKTLLDLNNCVEENDVMFLNLNELEPYFNFDFSPTYSEWTVSPKSDNPEETISKTLKVKYGSCDISTIEIYQNAKGCGCGNIHYGEEYVWTWDKKLVNGINVGGLEETIASFDDCVDMDEITITPDLSTLADFNVTLNKNASNSGGTLVASPKNNNDAAGAVQLVNTVKIDYLNCTQKTITLKQNNRGAYYLHFLTSDNKTSDTVSGDGEKKTLKYFVSASEDDNSAPFVGTDFVECQFSAPQIEGVTTGNTALTNGIYTVEVTFARNSITQDKPSVFTATCPTAAVTEKTVTLTQSGSEALYVHINCERGPVMYTGGDKHFEYYVSKYEEDDKTKAIDVACTLQCPTGIQDCGTETISNNVRKRTVKFAGNSGTAGIYWEFSATCEIATQQTVTKKVYQAWEGDNIIPNCDYFTFYYDWSDPSDVPGSYNPDDHKNGYDLDTLVQVNNVPSYNINGQNISLLTVGGGGTCPGVYVDNYSVFMRVILDENTEPLLKFGGDCRCNGSEYTIICLKHIEDYGRSKGMLTDSSVIYFDGYANWFQIKGAEHKTKLSYEQFTGTPTGSYSTEINEKKITDCANGGYYRFNPKTPNTTKIGDTVTKILPVNAAGGQNGVFAHNIPCLSDVYSHTFRLTYEVGEAITRFVIDDHSGTNGLDASSPKFVFGKYIIDSAVVENFEVISNIAPKVSFATHNIKYENLRFKNGVDRMVSLFRSDDDYVEIEMNVGGETVRHQYKKSDLGTAKDYDFIKEFKITSNGEGVDIVFKVDYSTRERQVYFNFYINNNFMLPCDSSLYKFGYIEIMQQNI